MPQQPIENYGVIGDLHTIALVGMDGSIDFLCFPQFDSPSVFAALLDPERGGHFRIAPELDGAKQRQLYLPDSCVLLTRTLADDGVCELSDFMPPHDAPGPHRVVRRIKTVRGELRYRMTCAPRFDYARGAHRVELRGDRAWFIPESPGAAALSLFASVPLRTEGGAVVAEFTLRADESASFVLDLVEADGAAPELPSDYVSASFKRTVNFWRRWIGRSHYHGRWRETVNRSALTLKLLTSRQYGSIVAAPTFGIPERVGGERNWDYRYTWIRDASFTLAGLMRLGYTDEAAAFMGWIEARCAEIGQDGSLGVMYRIDGGAVPDEETLAHLGGYMGSRPVRIGNRAKEQLQLDLYGELLDAVYLYDRHGALISFDLWRSIARLADWVCEHWRLPDEGIWEPRAGRQEFLHSRVMCWVALDRALRIAGARSFPAPSARWREVRDTIFADVIEGFWDAKRGTFVRHLGARSVDASSLLLPLVRFLSPTDPRWLSTLRAIEADLVDDSLVHRYRIGGEVTDGLEGQEGTFSMCTFWYVECLARSGDAEQARLIFEKMLGYANHLGLYAEELGARGEHLGNFPQAFAHLGLISAAHALDRALSEQGRPA